MEYINDGAIECDDVAIEILEPGLIVIPKLSNVVATGFSSQINVLITNNQLTPFPFVNHLLAIELVGRNTEALCTTLLDKQLPNNNYRGISIPFRRAIVRSLNTKILNMNDRFYFRGVIYDSSKTRINPNSSWNFELLEPENYQLRFTYTSPVNTLFFLDLSTGEITKIESSEVKTFASNWVNIRLIEPVKDNQNVVEVEGVQFETLVPQPIFSIPSSQPTFKVPVQIGIKITNNTLTTLRFTTFDSLIPFLIGADGFIESQSYSGIHGFIFPTESDFRLLDPGHNLVLFPKIELVKQENDLVQLEIFGGGKTSWWFSNLRLGKYQIGFTYRALTEKPDFLPDLLFQNLWMGMVYTPFIDFLLIEA